MELHETVPSWSPLKWQSQQHEVVSKHLLSPHLSHYTEMWKVFHVAWSFEHKHHKDHWVRSSEQIFLVPRGFWNCWMTNSCCFHHFAFLAEMTVECNTFKNHLKNNGRSSHMRYWLNVWQLIAVQLYKTLCTHTTFFCYVLFKNSLVWKKGTLKSCFSLDLLWLLQTPSRLQHCTTTASLCLHTAC